MEDEAIIRRYYEEVIIPEGAAHLYPFDSLTQEEKQSLAKTVGFAGFRLNHSSNNFAKAIGENKPLAIFATVTLALALLLLLGKGVLWVWEWVN